MTTESLDECYHSHHPHTCLTDISYTLTMSQSLLSSLYIDEHIGAKNSSLIIGMGRQDQCWRIHKLSTIEQLIRTVAYFRMHPVLCL